MIYENVRQLVANFGGNGYMFGRGLYKSTDCGPWTTFLLGNGETVYYGDDLACESSWHDACVGVQIGSIVEGSDVEVGPYALLFPFTSEELDEFVQNVNNEASFYWDRDNMEHFLLQWNGGDFYFKQGWWEPVKWPDEVPREVRAWAGRMSRMKSVDENGKERKDGRFLEQRIEEGEKAVMTDKSGKTWELLHLDTSDYIY